MRLTGFISGIVLLALPFTLPAGDVPAAPQSDEVPTISKEAVEVVAPHTCGKEGAGRGSKGMMRGRGRGGEGAAHRGGGRRGGMGGMGRSGDHATIHSLMAEHQKIRRTVTEIPGGVRTETTSEDPATAALILQHTLEMQARVENGTPIRMWDPLFREIFRNHEAIAMKVEEIDGGVRVIETSDDPEVAALIRQHAKVVNEFTAEGMARMHEPSPLP